MELKCSYLDLYRAAKNLLRQEDEETAEFTAQQLVAAATGRTVSRLVADFHLMASQREVKRTNALVQRHLDGEPVAYILGQWEFFGLTLKVSPDVLIPRDDTEAVCSLAIGQARQLPRNPRVLDLCAGSGCIGLAVARYVKEARVTLAELSPEALRVAKRNIQENHLTGRVSCVQLDVRREPPHFLGTYDLIVSNPPYVTAEEMERLDPSVRDYEPAMALYGGPDGLDFYRAIVKNFTPILRSGGSLCLEFGMGQEAAVCHLLMEQGYEVGRLVRDSGGRVRALIARKPIREE